MTKDKAEAVLRQMRSALSELRDFHGRLDETIDSLEASMAAFEREAFPERWVRAKVPGAFEPGIYAESAARIAALAGNFQQAAATGVTVEEFGRAMRPSIGIKRPS